MTDNAVSLDALADALRADHPAVADALDAQTNRAPVTSADIASRLIEADTYLTVEQMRAVIVALEESR